MHIQDGAIIKLYGGGMWIPRQRHLTATRKVWSAGYSEWVIVV